MPTFNTGDSIFILSKFAHLYAGDAAVVVSVKADPFRSIFDEYRVRFPDGSTDNLFEFQIRGNREPLDCNPAPGV
jgi:hypothetical protein